MQLLLTICDTNRGEWLSGLRVAREVIPDTDHAAVNRSPTHLAWLHTHHLRGTHNILITCPPVMSVTDSKCWIACPPCGKHSQQAFHYLQIKIRIYEGSEFRLQSLLQRFTPQPTLYKPYLYGGDNTMIPTWCAIRMFTYSWLNSVGL